MASGADTCGELDTRGLLLVLGYPTKAVIAGAICYVPYAERPVRDWAVGWPEVVELCLVLCGRSAGRVEIIIPVRTLHNMTGLLTKQQLADC